MGLLLLIVIVALLLGSLPNYRYSRDWGYRPSGAIGLVLVVFVVLLLLGSIPWGFASRPVYVANPAPVVVDHRPIVVNQQPARVVTPAPVTPAP